ncbi:Hpt domain-containing protein [Desulfonatronovibrio magnus]|uniref:Hpt domain-containing protein n=1 Tax=Desulfonatronovibrio magnus TaxID=698827 RepID=UPI0005EBB6F6|nr:Hpt domain-containing protein [Desulfonatronovibrio magnus]
MATLRDYGSIIRFSRDDGLKRCMGKVELAQEMSHIFVNESLPKYLPSLIKGVQERDCLLVQKNAHGIKGGCGAIGFIRCMEMAYDLEKAAKENDYDRVKLIFPLLLDEINEVSQLIKDGSYSENINN